MPEEICYSTDLPVLEYVYEHGGQHELLGVVQIAEGTGLDALAVAESLDRLSGARYLAGRLRRSMSGADPSPWFLEDSRLAERGLRVVGAWPSDDPYDALMALVVRQIASTEDPSRKTKLRALASSIRDVGQSVVAGLLVEYARGNIRL